MRSGINSSNATSATCTTSRGMRKSGRRMAEGGVDEYAIECSTCVEEEKLRMPRSKSILHSRMHKQTAHSRGTAQAGAQRAQSNLHHTLNTQSPYSSYGGSEIKMSAEMLAEFSMLNAQHSKSTGPR